MTFKRDAADTRLVFEDDTQYSTIISNFTVGLFLEERRPESPKILPPCCELIFRQISNNHFPQSSGSLFIIMRLGENAVHGEWGGGLTAYLG